MAVNVWSAAGAGNWSAGGNWSLGHAPQAGEDVLFDNTSVQNCTVDVADFLTILGDLTVADTYTGTVSAAAAKVFVVGGDVYLGTGVTWSWNTAATLRLKPVGAQTIETNGNGGHTITGVAGAGGSMQLVDALNMTTCNMTGFPWDQNGQDIIASGNLSITAAGCTWDGDISCSGMFVSLNSSNVTGSLTLSSTASITVSGSVTVARLILSAGETYTIWSGANVLTIGSYTAGDWDGATLQGNAGFDWNMSAPAGMVVSNMAVADSNNSGAAIDASDGTNTDNGDNTGWNFVAPAPPATASTPKQSKCSIGIGIGI